VQAQPRFTNPVVFDNVLTMTPRVGHAEVPARQVDGAGCLILGRAECLGLLAAGGLGRIAINVGALPAILPVRFGLQGDRVVLRVLEGSTLDRATRDSVVAFEADGPAADAAGEWSVTFTGIARHLPKGPESDGAEALRLPHWSNDGLLYRFVAISTVHLSGRQRVEV
jgi:hypothetical protein